MISNYHGVIICASKYYASNEMREIFKKGISNFGENRVNDLLKKQEELSDLNIVWHFIGNLQTNKIKKMINKISYLHSLESIEQAILIQKYRNNPLSCFIQINMSNELTKSGININKLNDFINELKKYDKIEIVGLMTIGIANELDSTEIIFNNINKLKEKYSLKYLSIGMTNDYELAIKNNATHIRLGSYFKNLIGGENGST